MPCLMRDTIAQSGDWCENMVVTARLGARVSADVGKLDERDCSLHVFKYQSYKKNSIGEKSSGFFFFSDSDR